MSYNVSLSNKATKQYKKLDPHIKTKIKAALFKLKEEPHNGFLLSGKHSDLLYRKLIHQKVEYRTVYEISDLNKEVLIIFLGTRENFYKELRRYLDKKL